MANSTDKKLLQLLKTIEGNGSFASAGVKDFVPLGLQINGVGEIGFPLNPILAKEIIKVSKKAPFGKGRQTITDPAVRSAWEIDADQLSFHYADWNTLLNKVLAEIKEGLGMESISIKASLYKLLLYQTGDFFLPHKDSEKEPGMFGTLVIGLPSLHTGGELAIRFDGREEIVDFSATASNYKLPYAAFFADCDHEIKPVTSGYRLALVYNLVYSARAKKKVIPKISVQADEIATLLAMDKNTTAYAPKVILLEHQYTPANFSLESLKHHDKPRAQALLAAADKAGYFARLGLVTHYQMGDMEEQYNSYSRRRRHYAEEEEESGGNGTMGEVHEESISIKHWVHETGPGLGELDIEEDDLITDITLGEGNPIEKEEEGYTGNAGMTVEYWYHYGAVMLWSASQHTNLLSTTPVFVRLQWLDYYLQHWDNQTLRSQEYAKQLIIGFQQIQLTPAEPLPADFNALATGLCKLQDEKFLMTCTELLTNVFSRISGKAWINLLQHYNPDLFTPVFKKATHTDNVVIIDHFLNILIQLETLDEHALNVFLSGQIRDIPRIISKMEFPDRKDQSYYHHQSEKRQDTVTAILQKVLLFSTHKPEGEAWVKDALKAITRDLPRKYVNKVLTKILLQRKYPHNALAKALYAVCIRELAGRTAIKPAPPSDWTREVPKPENYYLGIWDILRPFLKSPTEKVFEYRKAETYRNSMENAINNAKVDLKMETIKHGSPYTLKLTKTQAAYEKSLVKWQEDAALLEELNQGG